MMLSDHSCAGVRKVRVPTSFLLASFFLFPALGASAADAPKAAATAAAKPTPEKAAPAMPPAQVGVIELKKSPIPVLKLLPGRVKSVRVAQVRARVPGVLLKQKYADGADVKEGDLLFEIDAAVYEARKASALASVAQAEASIERANANFAQATQLAARYRELIRTNAVSQQELDSAVSAELQAKADVAGAKAGFLAAKAALKSAEIDLGYTRVTAPISGRIGRPYVTEGALVGQGEVTPLAEINQIESVNVDVVQTAGELLALRQKGGDNLERIKIKLLVDDVEYPHEGKPLLSEIAVEPTTSSVTWRVEFPNPRKHLWPGMYVRARFAYDDGSTAFLVPMQAVKRDPATAAGSVFVVGADNKLAVLPVQTSESSGPYWVVRQSDVLKEGMKLVVEGAERAMARLAAGSTVVPTPWVPNLPKPGVAPTPFER
ncbi:MAG: efflux RND transporter periplasmic adaptor subunit [Puniceicoccales bacterium]|jgi:membrane fusion protein (multidrug efflux system)|nr:efflux RND transporter periplasmic adaptor subunit [Puniceicoccales bacterium]